MDELRARIQDDLRGRIEGDVRCDDIFLQLYATDASIYEIRPLGVVRPRSTADVVACVEYAAENQLPVHARGAGTGLAGESLGPGLVIDFSKYMRRILRTDRDTVRVQPGLVLNQLNAHLLAFGRHFGPDPAMSHVTTIGSVVAIDAAGSHWLRYGSTRSHVESLQVVLADGHACELGRVSLVDSGGDAASPQVHDLVRPLAELLAREQTLINAKQPQAMLNRSGYGLAGVLSNEHLDLAKLLVGSEGTLALFTEITLSTDPLPHHRAVAMLLFDGLERAARAVGEILPFKPSACDLLDRRHLSLARETQPRYDLLIPPQAEAMLLVEQDGHSAAEVRDRLQQLVDRLRRKTAMAFEARLAFDPEDVELFWNLPRAVVPTLYRLKGSTRPLPFIEDVAVPPASLPGFVVQLQNILKRHQVTASLYAHAGHGQLHLRPFLDLSDSEDVAKIEPLAGDVYQAVFEVGGTISGEHGDGLSRTPFVPRQYGELYHVFREVKRIFDARNILNPGKIVGDTPNLMVQNLRTNRFLTDAPAVAEGADAATNGAGAPPRELLKLQLNWSPDQISHVVRSCNGCGSCRSQSAEVRMCPIFRFAPAEEASPRAKANLMRGILTGQLDASALARDELKAVADLCVNCQMCRSECPAEVDIPKLMMEAKGAYVATNGQRFRDWALSRVDLLSSVGSTLGPIANWAIANRPARWILEKTLGIAQGRKLPRFASQSFLRRARRRRLTRATRRSGSKVLYFVDTYANYHDPQLAEALVAVLEHNGVAVYVPSGMQGSGMAMLSSGAIAAARRVARHNVPLLAEAVRQGYEIVATEPTAALCLTRYYPELVDDDEARLVAEHTSEACAYLWKLHRAGKLRLDFKPVSATLGYHAPCHLKALSVGTPGENLLRLIPGMRVQKIEMGCSGMAGTFGLKRENFRNSLRAGWRLVSAMRHTTLQAGTTECSTCKMQIEQGANKPAIHPLKLLALAYGMMPEAAWLLTARTEELVVT